MAVFGHLRAIAILIALWIVPLAAPWAADVAGWQKARWGMTASELEDAFDGTLERLPGRWQYGGAYAEHAIFDVEIGGLFFAAYFQMNNETGRLQQVLLERRQNQATPAAFDVLMDEMISTYGEPVADCITPGPDGDLMAADLVWRFPTTTIHLGFLDFLTTSILFYDPFTGIDPLIPSYRQRLIYRRSLPRRITLRFHASEQENLISPRGCLAATERERLDGSQ